MANQENEVRAKELDSKIHHFLISQIVSEEMGELLSEILDKQLWVNLGFRSFQDYIYTKYINFGSAIAAIQLYKYNKEIKSNRLD